MTNIITQIDDYIGRTGVTQKTLFQAAKVHPSNYKRWKDYYGGKIDRWSTEPKNSTINKVLDVINKESANV